MGGRRKRVSRTALAGASWFRRGAAHGGPIRRRRFLAPASEPPEPVCPVWVPGPRTTGAPLPDAARHVAAPWTNPVRRTSRAREQRPSNRLELAVGLGQSSPVRRMSAGRERPPGKRRHAGDREARRVGCIVAPARLSMESGLGGRDPQSARRRVAPAAPTGSSRTTAVRDRPSLRPCVRRGPTESADCRRRPSSAFFAHALRRARGNAIVVPGVDGQSTADGADADRGRHRWCRSVTQGKPTPVFFPPPR